MSTVAGEQLGVVIVDDDPIFREIVCATLKKTSPFVVFEAGSGDDLIHILGQQSVDCIVLDYDLGMETGLAVKQRVEALRPERVPVVMLTGDGRESTAIRAFRMGIADYIPKRSLQTENLVRIVLNVVERSRGLRSEEEERRRLLAASSVDAATNLEGRTRLDERLTLLAALPPLTCSNYALILIEIVGYDAIVGRFGFKTADKALRAVAKQLPSLTRAGDVCGRYENGTFLVLADVRAEVELLRQICNRFAEGLATRLTSDVADIQLTVRVVGSLATPARDDAAASGTWHPALASARLAMEQAQASDATCLVAAGIPRGSAPVESLPAPAERPGGSGERETRPAAEALRSEDRRRPVRQRVLRKGLIHLLDRQSTINCTVRNLSTDGMGLRLDAPCAVPDIFDLEVFGLGAKKRVQVRWQLARDLGVEMIYPPDRQS